MNIEPKREKPSLTDELTVVLLRGNGSPRTFRLPVQTVQRALTGVAFAFCFALLAALFFIGLNFIRPTADRDSLPTSAVPPPPPPPPAAAYTAPANPSTTPVPVPVPVSPPSPAPVAEAPKTGIWQKITGGGGGITSSSGADSELKKEVDGLRQDNARLNAQIDARKELPKGVNAGGVLQLFGPRSVVMTEAETNIRVRNAKLSRDADGKTAVLNFELHNIDPTQKQERGYIVVIAKSSDMLLVYPPDAFSPTQNIVLDFTKGETFGISRFRAATATFSAALLSGKNTRFQILLFSTDGRIIANQHVEDKP